MKNWSGMVALALLLVSGPVAYADVSAQGGDVGPPQEGVYSTACVKNAAGSTNCNALLPAGTYVLGFKLINSTALTQAALFDAATCPTDATTKPVDELNEATAGEANLHIWPRGMKFNTGVSVCMNDFAGTTVIVYYGL